MQSVAFARVRRAVAATVLIALAGVLSGCGSINTPSFDPSDLFDFLDTKKKLPGDRRAVFPEGVPGLEQGVPKDLYKGAQASTANQPPPELPPAAEPTPKQKRTAARPKRQASPKPAADDGAAVSDEELAASAPPAAAPARRRGVQRPEQPEPPEQPGAFPAPLPGGSFAR